MFAVADYRHMCTLESSARSVAEAGPVFRRHGVGHGGGAGGWPRGNAVAGHGRGRPGDDAARCHIDFTVTARNANGTTNTGYLGIVHFTSSDPQGVLPADYTFTAADQGVHTFSATLKTAGIQSITATDTGPASTQAGITVNPAAASAFTVAGFPSPVRAGVAGSFTVTARDTYGNRATGYTGTVHFTSSEKMAGSAK